MGGTFPFCPNIPLTLTPIAFRVWRRLAEFLKRNFTVVMYDRRGYSRSTLQGEQDYSFRLETDADDAAALLKHLSQDNPAIVLGSSSGAIVALQLLVRHSEVVELLLCHEPPAISVLPDFEELNGNMQDVYQTYHEKGILPAVEKFATFIKAGYEHDALVASLTNPHAAKNVTYWFEHEMAYPQHGVDLGALEKQHDKLILLLGAETDKSALQYRPNLVIAEKLVLEPEIVPGMHVGYAMFAETWAKTLVQILKQRHVL